jgi:hypothetical protein
MKKKIKQRVTAREEKFHLKIVHVLRSGLSTSIFLALKPESFITISPNPGSPPKQTSATQT